MVRQAVASLEQERNLNSFTQARFLQTYYNSHIGENSTPVEDLSLFLPHPNQWLIQNMDRKVHVDRKAAILFLQTYTGYGSEVLATFNDWIRELELIAVGN